MSGVNDPKIKYPAKRAYNICQMAKTFSYR